MDILQDAAVIAQALLAVFGGLTVVSRYTPWKWDDKIFKAAESAAKKALEFLPKQKKDEK